MREPEFIVSDPGLDWSQHDHDRQHPIWSRAQPRADRGALDGARRSRGPQTPTPSAVNNTAKDGQLGGSYGWQQWLADRRTALNGFAQSSEWRPSDPTVQAKFFDHEMRTGQGAGSLASQDYWSATTPDAATIAMAHFGRGAGYTPDHPENTVGFANGSTQPDRFTASLFHNLSRRSVQPGGAAPAPKQKKKKDHK